MSITSVGKRQNAGIICNVHNNSINNTYNTYTSDVLTLGVHIGIGGCSGMREPGIWRLTRQEKSPITAFLGYDDNIFLSGNFHYF